MWENIVVFKLLSFHAYIEICQCENKCMIFFQRFTIPDVSIALYLRCEVADKTNACFSCCVIRRSYAPMFQCENTTPDVSITVNIRCEALIFLKYSAKLYHDYNSE